MTTLNIPDMIAATAGDVHPPLWYLIEWVVTHLIGHSEFALRLPSVLFGSLATVEVYHIGKRHSERAGRWASVLFAIMPGAIRYGAEARMYALLTLLVLMAARSLIERRWWRFYPAVGLILYTHNLGAIYSAVLLIAALFVDKRHAIFSGAAAAASFAPWSITLLQQMQDVSNGFWLPAPGNFGGALYYLLFTTFNTPPEILTMHAAGLAVALTLIALVVTFSNKQQRPPLLYALAFAPPLVLYVVSLVWRPVLLPRALMPSGAALVLLWGVMLSEIKPRQRAAVLSVLLPMLAATLGYHYWQAAFDGGRADMSYVSEIEQRYQPGDLVYHGGLDTLVVAGYYMPDMPQYVIPSAGNLAQSLTDQTKTAMGIMPRQRSIDDLRADGYRRAFVMVSETPVTADSEWAEMQRILSTYPTVESIPVMSETVMGDEVASFRIVIVDLQ